MNKPSTSMPTSKKITLLSLVLLASVSGCSSDQAEETVCADLLRSVAADPDSVKINSSKLVSVDLTPEQFKTEHASYSGERAVSQAMAELVTIYESAGYKFSKIYADMDATYLGQAGITRGKVVCTYLKAHETSSLVEIDVSGSQVRRQQFIDFFMLRDRPARLSSTYNVD